MARIIVAGWVAQFPTAPFLWHVLSFALGFRELGHDVWFLEDPGDVPWGWDNLANVADPTLRAGVRFLESELPFLGFEDRWIVRHPPEGRWEGLPEDVAKQVIADADILVNISLTTPARPEYRRIPQRVAVDTDPVFTQIRIAQGLPPLVEVPSWHTRLFTFGRPPLPAQQHEWVPTRQPVAMDLWPVLPLPPVTSGLTSVLAWQSYPPVRWAGHVYGAKDLTFLDYRRLPRSVGVPLRLAVGGSGSTDAVREELRTEGWLVEDARLHTASSAAYRSFLNGSLGEFGLAKQGYVASRSGWFSERTCCYLASGRPAVVQDTGWTDYLPHDEGLIAFSSPAAARAGIETVLGDPERHARAARALVERHFGAADVCADILARL